MASDFPVELPLPRPAPEGEAALVARAATGDHEAYAALVGPHQRAAYRVAAAITGWNADAQEALQNAHVKAFRSLRRFRRGAPFAPWLLRIVVNEARNRRVAAARRTNLALRVASADAVAADLDPFAGPSGHTGWVPGLSGDAAPSPEAAALAAERAAELLAAVNALREEDRAVIACRYFLDLSEAETAATLGLPRGTVKSRLSRALARVRALLTAPAAEQASRRDGDG
jgi:RNA polymerase sigma factor (sigma-70 family)